MKKLALITVLFENYTILDDYFATLKEQTDMDFHVYVLDLTPRPKDYPYPEFASSIHDENNGYAYGINRGMKKALEEGYDFFCVMNCDVTVRNDFVQNTKKSLAKNPRTIIGGKIYYYPGYEYHKERYSKEDRGNVLWYAGGSTDWKNAYTVHRGVDEIDKGQFEKSEKVTFITGCLMAYDKSVVEKIGKWKEDYFLFYEDADYCARAVNAGIDLRYDPSIIIWHKSGQSTSGAASTFQQMYLKRNRLIFGLRFAPWKTKFHLIKNYLLDSIKQTP